MPSMPKLHEFSAYTPPGSLRRQRFYLLLLAVFSCAISLAFFNVWVYGQTLRASPIPPHAAETLQMCRILDVTPGPPPDFNLRKVSDRFEMGTKPVLLRNASIWTGRVSGLEVIMGDLLLDKGLIKSVGSLARRDLAQLHDLTTIDLGGSWVSPGIVDLHSHLGVDSVPSLRGSRDTNSLKGLVQPWLRSLDGLNTHDDAYQLSISGGVTTANVLPGSANAIGGQAYTIKLRPTKERSPVSMLLEPPFDLNGTDPSSMPIRWRQMKHACGENPSRVYSGTRMDTMWAFRQGYETARKIKIAQDKYCAKALAGQWDRLGAFPEVLQWEALVDVLRGRVKVHNHCYEAVDLDGIVRLTNEFKFSIAAFHHAHETYLVPELLKKAYGHPPAIALFATNARYKREAYRGSEFAPRVLADNGLNVVMKSDHPVLNSRFLLYEAQQAHYYGLPSNLALASVTSTPASAMGMDHRIGYIQEGKWYDADVVVWDSHPLALGATPKQVYIDGIPQLSRPFSVQKPPHFQVVPRTPNFDKETADAIKYDGLPPLVPSKAKSDLVIFTNVSSIFMKREWTVQQILAAEHSQAGVVVIHQGDIVCSGIGAECPHSLYPEDALQINLEGGSISPGLYTYGSPLGLQEIAGEVTTSDGFVYDPLLAEVPRIVGGHNAIIKAVDGLQFSGRDALLAYRSGVTSGIVSPKSPGFLSGLGTAFSTGAIHKLEEGAVIQDVTALHVNIGHGSSTPSVSTQVAVLRRLLLGGAQGELGVRFREVTRGELPLVVTVHNADAMASLIQLKTEVEEKTGRTIRLTFNGASESHLLAREISHAGIGVILSPPRSFPATWESRRILPGLPLTQKSSVSTLLAENVTVGLGVEGQWTARNIRFDIAWAALDANGAISKADAIALASVNLEKLLGIQNDAISMDLVATQGGSLLDFQAKVVGVISSRRGGVYLL